MLATDQQLVLVYIFFWIIRINGCIRRGRQPLLRGPEWFFDVHVRPDFYKGPGKKLLHRYWLRMLIPFAVDIPIVILIFVSGHPILVTVLILALCALIHINHLFSVNLAERQARPFAMQETEQPVATVALSLTPRRLRDYTNAKVEWALALCNIAAFAWLIRYYFAAPDHHNLRWVFGAPVLYVYLQVGILYVKQIVIAWRTPVPQIQAAEHIEVREQTRKYYLKMCDFNRITAAAALLFWPVLLSAPPAAFDRLFNIWLAVWVVITIVATVWVELKRKQLVKIALRARPVKLPDFLQQSDMVKWPLCYQPSAPMLVLKGSRGYSLNLANTLSHLGAAYLAGMVVIFALLRLGH
jgi:hypothetical protein